MGLYDTKVAHMHARGGVWVIYSHVTAVSAVKGKHLDRNIANNGTLLKRFMI